MIAMTVRKMPELILHHLLPRVCSLCAQALDGAGERSARLCHACESVLPGAAPGRCLRCALRHSPAGSSRASCPLEAEGRLPWDVALAWVDYAYPVDGWIHALKFKSEANLAEGLGRGLARSVQLVGQSLGANLLSFDAVVPMPLSAQRLAERGYNQTELIARAFVREVKHLREGASLAIDHFGLRRVRHGPALSLQSATERPALMRGAYVAGADLKGKRVALIDDVMTTGATLVEATRTLREAGVGSVVVMVVARTPV